jgi:CARDB
MNKKTAGILLILALIAIPGLLQACAQAHPSYQVLSFNLTPTKAVTGEKVTIVAEVKNINSETDTFNIPLMVNGVADSRESVTLASGQSELLTYELTRSQAGSYKISIGGKVSTLIVDKPSPANFQLSDLQVNPIQVDVCESVVITAKLTNIGGGQGSYTAKLNIDGVVNQTQELNVPAGANCLLCFKIAKSLPGTYQVALGNLSGEFTVKEPPAAVFNIPVAPPCPPASSGPCSSGG